MAKADAEVEQYRKLAIAVVTDAIECLKRPPPRQKPFKGQKREYWLRNWSDWEADRMRDLRFFRDPTICGPWCAMAGVDRETILARLEAEGYMYDAKDVYPVSLGGLGKKDGAVVRCAECNMEMHSKHGRDVHAVSCVGQVNRDRIVYEYEEGRNITNICKAFNVSHTTLYKLLDANGVERRRG